MWRTKVVNPKNDVTWDLDFFFFHSVTDRIVSTSVQTSVSVSDGVISRQWKAASISPVPKLSSPASLSDIRPISISSVLSRAIERLVVRQFIYPALLTLPPSLVFSDQFAFRPSGSTTAAVIAILQAVTNLLSDHPYVIVISL